MEHWIAFGLQAAIGGAMVRDAFLESDEATARPATVWALLAAALATSLDASAVGIGFGALG